MEHSGDRSGVCRVSLTNMKEKTLVRPRRRWEDYIKIDLQEMRCGDMDWMELAKDRGRWLALANAVMNLRVP